MKKIFLYILLLMSAIFISLLIYEKIGDIADPHILSNTQEASGKPEKHLVAYPILDFYDRIWLNPFGNRPSENIDQSKYSDYICQDAKGYAGYHTAVDLEIKPEEEDSAVSIYSISDGTVKRIGFANGYGGLIVIEYNIEGEIYTAYFGHIDLDKTKIKAGDFVKKGEKIAELAPKCSSKNGNTRKHLHFGIHKGKSIDVAGYVTDKKSLLSWIDPREFFQKFH